MPKLILSRKLKGWHLVQCIQRSIGPDKQKDGDFQEESAQEEKKVYRWREHGVFEHDNKINGDLQR